jgi:hypothetical protein
MTFSKPSTITSQTGAYRYKGGFSSVSSNYIDNSFPYMLDKRGDVITGELQIVSGGNITIQTGGSITGTGLSIGNGNIVFSGSSGMQFDNTSTLTMSDTSSIIIGATASLSNAGTLNMTSSGIFNLESGATFNVQPGGLLQVVTGGAALQVGSGSSLNMQPGSNLYLDNCSTMIISGTTTLSASATLTTSGTAFLTMGSGSTLTMSSGSTLNIHGTFKSDSFAAWNVLPGRIMIESTTSGYPVSGTWTGAPQFVYDNAAGGIWAQQLQRTHNGATLVQIIVGLAVGTGHSNVPANRPSLSLVRYAWNNMFAYEPLSTTDPQVFPNPGSGSAYYAGGAQQSMTYVCNQNNVIDNTTYIYALLITDESGANSEALNAFGLIYELYEVIPNQSWNI